MTLARSLSALVFSVVVTMAGVPAEAEDLQFLGIGVFSQKGTYLVTKGATVRAEPMTKAKKLGKLRAGEQVQVVGRAKGGAGWMAIQKNGKDYGFVYKPILLPIIDGTLKESISGVVMIEEHAPCGYTFNFHGKNTVEGEDYIFSDYEITYRCNDKGKPFRLLAAMFMSEVPFRLTHEPVFQISIDLMEVENGYDEIFSTVFEYRPDEKKVVFAGVSLKGLERTPKEKERPVNTIVEALTAAVEIAPDAWGKKVWKQIHKVQIEGNS
jgi:hypothetical protein